MTTTSLIAALIVASPLQGGAPATRRFTLREPAEVVATITASCAPCDWSAPGREAVLLELAIDDKYSQHVALTRGEQAAPYRVILGPLAAGPHRLTVRRDAARSARQAGPAAIEAIDLRAFTRTSPEYDWLSRAPLLRARPGAVERFSDVPLLMYVENNVRGEDDERYRFQYTVIFTNEDGGTPTDRLMATWGRTTDIEFVFGVTTGADGARREVIQSDGHRWVDFAGPHVGAHPVLWVATDNNMVADHGPDGAVTFAPAPAPFDLARTSREAVMDAEPWTYGVTSAEMAREGRIDPAALAGSGKIPDPRRYATVEACADVTGATLAFDVGVRAADGRVVWYPTDRGDPRFRIARGGCVRGGAPLSPDVAAGDIAALRVRAYLGPPRDGDAPAPRPRGAVVLRRVNRVFMLDSRFTPSLATIRWSGELPVELDGAPVDIPVSVGAPPP